ncbi:radical SAM protein [Flexibacterium corallicola]|uniref:radical SAM protein n=1 Tax=Flexibacterium corallicola TaxID=3037259 RepID=UPI00286F23C8|nr:radical SAM protein [Pseudovibrio sp. M1P-2-3]
MSAESIFAPKFDHLVYIRVFEGCNLHCLHCFIPSNPKRMTFVQIEEAGEHINRLAKSGQKVLIQWHGGEPTLLGVEYLSKSIDILSKTVRADVELLHGIQTNLMTYNRDWSQLYHTHFNSSIGVSWDPVIRLLPGAKLESNVQYEARFWNNWDRMLSDGIKPYLVMTATRQFFDSYPNPIHLLNELSQRGVKHGHIERLTQTGYADKNWDYIGVDNLYYSKKMASLLTAYLAWNKDRSQGDKLYLSPFDGLLASVDTLKDQNKVGYGCWSGKCDSRFHTIDAEGYKFGCTALTSGPEGGSSLSPKVLESRRFERRAALCHSCEYRVICSSGCLALSYVDDSGECSGSKTLFNRAEMLLRIRNG